MPGRGGSIKLSAVLVIIFVFPSWLFYTYGTSSQAPGLTLAAIFVVLATLLGWRSFKLNAEFFSALAVTVLLFLAILTHGLVAYQIQASDISRLLLSLGLSLASILAAIMMASNMFESHRNEVRQSIFFVFALLVFVSLFAIFGLRPYLPALAASNPIFPFTEPSHLALVLAPFSFSAAIISSGWKRLTILFTLIIIALSLKSMSIVIICFLISILILSNINLLFILLFAFFIFPFVDSDYFSQRLDFNLQNTNLSNLVYLQGWELLSDSLNRTYGWGLGFQQLGIGQYKSHAADLVYSILKTTANIRDGSFTLAKICSEFGIFGIIFSIWYFYIVIKCFIALRNYKHREDIGENNVIIAQAFVASSVVEMLVRGIGYFSPSFLFLTASMVYLYRKGKLV